MSTEKKCPACGSADLIKASLAYEANTSETRSTSTGIGVSTGGFGIGGAVTEGSAQTLLAQRVAPPEQSQLAGFLTLLCVGIVAWLCYHFGAPWWAWLIGIIGAGVAIAPLSLKEDQENEKRMRDYNKKWLCQRCGAVTAL